MQLWPWTCRQSVWGHELAARCQRLGMSFPTPATIIYQKWRFSWHGKQQWPHSEMAPKARAITGWTSHSSSCFTAMLGPFVGWLRELIQPRSWRGTKQSFTYALLISLWGGNKQNQFKQEEKEVGMAQCKEQKIWGIPETFDFRSCVVILTMCKLFNFYELVSLVDKFVYNFCVRLF